MLLTALGLFQDKGEEQDPADAGPMFLACRQENIFSADHDQQYLEEKKKRRKIEDALSIRFPSEPLQLPTIEHSHVLSDFSDFCVFVRRKN